MKQSHVYTIEAGRSILRDGKPFVYVGRTVDPVTGAGAPPVDADEFAQFAAEAPALVRELAEALLDCATELHALRGGMPKGSADWQCIDAARVALAKVGR